MKFFILMSISLFSFASFGQGALLEENRDKLLQGVEVLKLGGEYTGSGKLIHYSAAPQWHQPIKASSPEVEGIIAALSKEPQKQSEVTIACKVDSKFLNGIYLINRIEYCHRTSDGKVLYRDAKMSDAQGLALKSKIDRVIVNNEDEKVVFAKPVVEAEKPLSAVIDSPIVKCADGTKKEHLKMGRLNRTYNQTYIAKSNNQDFVTISPDGSVNLYYCAPRRLVWVNGVQKQEIIPVAHYTYSLGSLNDRANCDFSDIISGSVELTFQGSYYPSRVAFRAIMETDAEKSEFKKLCLDPSNERSFNVQDSPTGSAQ